MSQLWHSRISCFDLDAVGRSGNKQTVDEDLHDIMRQSRRGISHLLPEWNHLSAESPSIFVTLIVCEMNPARSPLRMGHDVFRVFDDHFDRANHQIRVCLHDPVIALSR